MKAFFANHKGVIILVSVFLALNAIFLFISPDTVVQKIGVQNTYLTIFLIAAIGGLNSFTGGVFYASLAAFAAGGASPWILGLSGGLGLVVGDSLVFFLFKYGSSKIDGTWKARVQRAEDWIEKFSQPVQNFIIYLYLAISPFPNDILMFGLAVFKYRFIQVLPLILLGDVTFAVLVALLGERLPFLNW